MNRKLVFLILIFYLISFSYLYAFENIDTLLADVYIEHAYRQFETGNYKEAFELSKVSLSFSGTVSDALFIHAVSGREIGEGSSSQNDLYLSIVSDSWKYYDETTARVYLSMYRYVAGEIESAYINLEPFKFYLSRSSFYSEVFIKIALSLQKIEDAVIIAGKRLEVDPFDEYSQLTMAMFNSDWLMAASKNILEGDPAGFYSRKLVQSIIRRSTGNNMLLDYYRNRWGADNFYNIAILSDTKGNIESSLSLLFPDNSSVLYEDLLWGFSLLMQEGRKKSVLNYLNSITVEIRYDVNSDSIKDTKAIFHQGVLTDFRFDSNQDGSYDFVVDFTAGKPQKIVLDNGERSIFLYYRDYPNLIRVVDSSPDYKREYQLIPYSVSFDPLDLPEQMMDGIPVVLTDYSVPSDTVLTQNSTKKSTEDLTLDRVENYIRIGSEESVEKVFEAEGTKIVERHYRNSVLITLYSDSDSDGVFDTVYNYNDALLTSVTFDGNNNGVFDYMENYIDGFVRSWDFNEDGIIDTRDRYVEGVMIREISTEMNGIFDTSFELSPGNIK